MTTSSQQVRHSRVSSGTAGSGGGFGVRAALLERGVAGLSSVAKIDALLLGLRLDVEETLRALAITGSTTLLLLAADPAGEGARAGSGACSWTVRLPLVEGLGAGAGAKMLRKLALLAVSSAL